MKTKDDELKSEVKDDTKEIIKSPDHYISDSNFYVVKVIETRNKYLAEAVASYLRADSYKVQAVECENGYEVISENYSFRTSALQMAQKLENLKYKPMIIRR